MIIFINSALLIKIFKNICIFIVLVFICLPYMLYIILITKHIICFWLVNLFLSIILLFKQVFLQQK